MDSTGSLFYRTLCLIIRLIFVKNDQFGNKYFEFIANLFYYSFVFYLVLVMSNVTGNI